MLKYFQSIFKTIDGCLKILCFYHHIKFKKKTVECEKPQIACHMKRMILITFFLLNWKYIRMCDLFFYHNKMTETFAVFNKKNIFDSDFPQNCYIASFFKYLFEMFIFGFVKFSVT